MSLSQNIKTLRLKNNLTQEQLSEMLGVSPQAVSKWETSETFPDGTLLVPLAKALGTSLDELFDNDSTDMAGIASHIIRKFSNTPAEKLFEVARDICWQIEKGLFGYDMGYHPDEYRCMKSSSYILNDFGFTVISNGSSPFFSVFPEPENGFGETVGDGEEMRRICECLAAPETMRAVVFLHKKAEGFIFDADFLKKECGIDDGDIDKVIKSLSELKIIVENVTKINGVPHTLYKSAPSHKLIAMFIMAHEMNYCGMYSLQNHCRNVPLLK